MQEIGKPINYIFKRIHFIFSGIFLAGDGHFLIRTGKINFCDMQISRVWTYKSTLVHKHQHIGVKQTNICPVHLSKFLIPLQSNLLYLQIKQIF